MQLIIVSFFKRFWLKQNRSSKIDSGLKVMFSGGNSKGGQGNQSKKDYPYPNNTYAVTGISAAGHIIKGYLSCSICCQAKQVINKRCQKQTKTHD
jgi:hypothetical protein